MDELDREIVKLGPIGRPRVGIGDLEPRFELGGAQRDVVLRHGLARAGEREPHHPLGRLGKHSFHDDRPSREVVGASNRKFAQVNRIARLDSRRLPDSALDPIPVLLSGQRLAESAAVAVVGDARVDAERERGLAVERIGQVDLDRSPAVAMNRNRNLVDEDHRFVEHALHDENDAFPRSNPAGFERRAGIVPSRARCAAPETEPARSPASGSYGPRRRAAPSDLRIRNPRGRPGSALRGVRRHQRA